MTGKRCPSCGKAKGRECFYRESGRTNGMSCYCKDCVRMKYGKTGRRRPQAVPIVERKCFRCGLSYRSRYKLKYCSKKCRYEGQSDRMQFEVEVGTGKYDNRPRLVPFIDW